MNKLDKETMKKYLIQLAEQAEASGMEFGGYVGIMLKKLYNLFHLRSGGVNNGVDYHQEIEEWLELMAFCEQMAMLNYWNLPKKEMTEEKFKQIYKRTKEIRNGEIDS